MRIDFFCNKLVNIIYENQSYISLSITSMSFLEWYPLEGKLGVRHPATI